MTVFGNFMGEIVRLPPDCSPLS